MLLTFYCQLLSCNSKHAREMTVTHHWCTKNFQTHCRRSCQLCLLSRLCKSNKFQILVSIKNFVCRRRRGRRNWRDKPWFQVESPSLVILSSPVSSKHHTQKLNFPNQKRLPNVGSTQHKEIPTFFASMHVYKHVPKFRFCTVTIR